MFAQDSQAEGKTNEGNDDYNFFEDLKGLATTTTFGLEDDFEITPQPTNTEIVTPPAAIVAVSQTEGKTNEKWLTTTVGLEDDFFEITPQLTDLTPPAAIVVAPPAPKDPKFRSREEIVTPPKAKRARKSVPQIPYGIVYLKNICNRVDRFPVDFKIHTSWFHKLMGDFILLRGHGCADSTIDLGMTYIGKYINHSKTVPDELQKNKKTKVTYKLQRWLALVEGSCLFVAAKTNEVGGGFALKTFTATCFKRLGIFPKDVLKVERELLQILNWNVHLVTPFRLLMARVNIHPSRIKLAKVLKQLMFTHIYKYILGPYQ